MTQQYSDDYYAVRAAVSRQLAQRAASPEVAAIHAELAGYYDVLAIPTHPRNDRDDASNQLI